MTEPRVSIAIEDDAGLFTGDEPGAEALEQARDYAKKIRVNTDPALAAIAYALISLAAKN